MGFTPHLLPDFSFPSLSYSQEPPSSSVPSRPFLQSRSLHKGHASSSRTPKLLSPFRQDLRPPQPWPPPRPLLRTPARAARRAPTPLGREPGHPSSEAGTAAPGPSHRKPPPPGARAAPPRPTTRGPPPASHPAPPARPRAESTAPIAPALATCRGHRSGAQLRCHFRLPPPALGPGHVTARGHLTRKRLARAAGVGNLGRAWLHLSRSRPSYHSCVGKWKGFPLAS